MSDRDSPDWPTCPDCNTPATADGRYLLHDDTCPLGLGIDEACATDRLYFDLHPHLNERRRPPHWAEIADLRLLQLLPPVEVGSVEGEVVVRRVGPGIRARSFDDLYVVLTR